VEEPVRHRFAHSTNYKLLQVVLHHPARTVDEHAASGCGKQRSLHPTASMLSCMVFMPAERVMPYSLLPLDTA